MILCEYDENADGLLSGTQHATTYGRNDEHGNMTVVASATQMYRRRNARLGNINLPERASPD
jgi:hypothetical protein